MSLRRVGDFAKDTTPFSKFLWADFIRRRMKRKIVETGFNAALGQALKLAKSEDADYLPRLVRTGGAVMGSRPAQG